MMGEKVLVGSIDYEEFDENDPEDEAHLMLKVLLAPAEDYKLIWDDRNCPGGTGVSIWQPIPPPSYVSLGHIATKNNNAVCFLSFLFVDKKLTSTMMIIIILQNKPSRKGDVVMCVHESVTYAGSLFSSPVRLFYIF